MAKDLGKFCSVAAKGTLIHAPEKVGYITPEPVALETNGQVINFKYTPIVYDINYVTVGGTLPDNIKKTYTIEDPTYYPAAPTRPGYIFTGWSPQSLQIGEYGNKEFTATWIDEPVCIPGQELNFMLSNEVGLNNIVNIINTDTPLDLDYIDISCTRTPIYAYYDMQGLLAIYSPYGVKCNKDMSGAFKGLSLLRNIAALETWTCEKNMDISFMFENCAILADVSPVNNWGNYELSNFTGCFNNTSAALSRRIPSWYKWNVTIECRSITGKLLKREVIPKIPNEIVYASSINAYKYLNESVVIDSPIKTYIFEYEPVLYPIVYNTDGGEFTIDEELIKDTYTIEEDFYPRYEIVKDGYRFTGWDPNYIPVGTCGLMTFNAILEKE